MTRNPVVIVGAGQAAASVALRLRANGYPDPILILGDEGHPPYQRPPLSKKHLAGANGADGLYIRPPAFWREAGVQLGMDTHVERIDVAGKSLHAGSERIVWSRLVLATGSRARPIPEAFAGRDNVFELRSLADVRRLAPHFTAGKRLAVVGGGFIGLETAAVARRAGLDVTVIERAPRILERAVCPNISTFIRDLHQSNGVRVIEGRAVLQAVGERAVNEIILDDGETIAADLVLLGIGVVAESGLAKAAGLATGDGIIVDARGRTSAPDIWAAGDCTAFPYQGELIRLENVQNAIDQAEVVADDICGRPASYAPVPWFWSDQYESKLQIVGLARDHDGPIVRPGERGGISSWYFKGDRLVAVAAVDDVRAYMTAKRLLERGVPTDRERIADPTLDLRSLLAA
jgi:3-phenylpropionate/trans-cinnamate dioxygenase ferredoxin reductase subunit